MGRKGGARRCWWCGDDPLYQRYHDQEWGFPVAEDRRLFEKVCLEGFQSGLAWITILRKREAFRRAFHDFDPERVARYGEEEISQLLQNAEIIRHRGKIEATINNARRLLELYEEFDTFAAYVWQFEPDPEERPTTLDERSVRTLAHTASSTPSLQRSQSAEVGASSALPPLTHSCNQWGWSTITSRGVRPVPP